MASSHRRDIGRNGPLDPAWHAELATRLTQGGAPLHLADEFEDVLALEVAVAGHSVGGLEFTRVVAWSLPYRGGCLCRELALYPHFSRRLYHGRRIKSMAFY